MKANTQLVMSFWSKTTQMEKTNKLKSSAPVAFVSKKFTRGQTPLALYAKKFLLAIHLASDEFRRISCGTKKLIIVMTDNKALTRFLSG